MRYDRGQGREDIEVKGSDVQGDRPPDDIMKHSRDFWAARAEVLHQLFPDVEPLELILFTASSTNVVLTGAGEGQSQRV